VQNTPLKIYTPTKSKWVNPIDSFWKFEKGVEKE